MNRVALAVVPRSAVRPGHIARAAAAVDRVPVFVPASGALDPEERAEYASFGPVVECDPADPGATVDRLRDLAPDGILTFSEGMLPLTTELAAGLGLPNHDRETMTALTDKWDQRRRRAEGGVDAVWAALVTSRPEALAAIGSRPGPVVVKPKRGQSSQDTYLVTTPADLPAQLVPSVERPFVVEEFLRGRPSGEFGDFVSVESLVVDGVPATLGVTGKFPQLPPFREQGQFFPAHLPPDECAELADLASAAAVALGVRQGLVHTEIKLTGQGPRIIEVNGRIGGYLAGLYQRATGQDLLALGIAVACGQPVRPRTGAPVGPIQFLYGNSAPTEGGVLREVRGMDAVRQDPAIIDYITWTPPGTALVPGDAMTRLLDLLYGSAVDHRAVLATIDRCQRHLRYVLEQPDGALRVWRPTRSGPCAVSADE